MEAVLKSSDLQDGGEQAEAAEAQPVKGKATATEQVLDTIKEVENEGEDAPLDTVHDAILARQLAEELEGGVYAKVCSFSLECLPAIDCIQGTGQYTAMQRWERQC